MRSFVSDFIALEIVESELVAFHDDNFCKFHVLYACISDACAVETRRQFVTERRKKRKRKPKPKPRPHCLQLVSLLTGSQRGQKKIRRASGSQSVVTPRAKRVGRGGAPLHTPSSPDRSRFIPFALDCTWLSPTGAYSQAITIANSVFL